MALLHRPPAGLVLNYFYTFECFVPAQVCNVHETRVEAFSCAARSGVRSQKPLPLFVNYTQKNIERFSSSRSSLRRTCVAEALQPKGAEPGT